jgi:hypothetical protein
MSRIVVLSYAKTINKPKHPKKGEYKEIIGRTYCPRRQMTHLRGGSKSWGPSFVVCLG